MAALEAIAPARLGDAAGDDEDDVGMQPSAQQGAADFGGSAQAGVAVAGVIVAEVVVVRVSLHHSGMGLGGVGHNRGTSFAQSGECVLGRMLDNARSPGRLSS